MLSVLVAFFLFSSVAPAPFFSYTFAWLFSSLLLTLKCDLLLKRQKSFSWPSTRRQQSTFTCLYTTAGSGSFKALGLVHINSAADNGELPSHLFHIKCFRAVFCIHRCQNINKLIISDRRGRAHRAATLENLLRLFVFRGEKIYSATRLGTSRPTTTATRIRSCSASPLMNNKF